MNLITKALLDFDVVAEVDRLCPGNSEAMLAVSFVWSEMTREHMQSIGDSHYGMTFDKMLELVHSEGFVEIYKKDFVDDDTDDGNSRTESYYVFYHSDGIILTLESYLGRVNTARMYYNIMLRNGAGSYHNQKRAGSDTMKVAFISDIHANFELYADICNEHEDTIQVGDFGIGHRPELTVLFSEPFQTIQIAFDITTTDRTLHDIEGPPLRPRTHFSI